MTNCKLWQGRKDRDGYGLQSAGSRDIRVHRLAWEALRGQIPRGLSVLHKCDNRACWNVEHLFLGTQAENMKDMTAKGRRKARSPVGELAATSKLTLAQVEAIRRDTRTGSVIAQEYGVSSTNIYNIRRGLIWRHGNGHYGDGVFVAQER